MIATLLALLAALPWTGQDAPVERQTLDDGRTIEREVTAGADGQGVWTLLSKEGTKLASGKIERGLPTGTWRFRDDDGELRAKGPYAQGLRSGKWTFFDAQGELLAEGRYADGQRDGTWSYVGRPELSGTFRHAVEAHPAGARKSAGLTLDGRRHGRWSSWWPNGIQQLDARFIAGRPVGPWRYWHADGTFDREMYRGLDSEVDPYDLLESELRGVEALFEDEAVSGIERGDSDDAQRQPAELLPLPRVDDLDAEQEEAIQAALREFRSGTESVAEAALIDLEPNRRAVLQRLLSDLLALDLSSEADLQAGARYQILFDALGVGSFFAWEQDTKATARKRNRMQLLRLHSLCSLTADHPVFWQFDVALLAELPALRRKDVGRSLLLSPPSFAAASPSPSPTFGNKRKSHLRRAGGAGTEDALRGALDWLVRHQAPDGRWDCAGFQGQCRAETPCEGSGDRLHDVGVTGLAMMALLADGSSIDRGPHAEAVSRGLRWLVSQQRPSNGQLVAPKPGENGKQIYSWANLFENAIAARVLVRASKEVDSATLREAAQLALQFLHRARNPYGVWRYDAPPVGANDTAVTGWVVQALIEARDAGYEIEDEALAGAAAWITEVTDPATGRVGYMEAGSEPVRYRDVNDHFPASRSESLTAVGLLGRQLLGANPSESSMMGKHAELLRRHLPEWDVEGFGCDMYYWYFGTYAARRYGGDLWESWNEAMRQAVLDSQRKDGDVKGSWDPIGPWGYAGGRVYSTALMALCLEVYLEPFEPQSRR